MILKRFLLTEYRTNCYLFGDEQSGEVAVIDPGAPSQKLIDTIEENGYRLKYILLTHGHYDHICGVKFMKESYPEAKIAIHKEDAVYLYDESTFPKDIPPSFVFQENHADVLLSDGDELQVGVYTLKVLYTPGHSNGGISLLCKDIIFTGDTLFHQSIGRTDFPDSSYEKIVQSVQRLYTLDDAITAYPGHGFSTTIGYEKKFNPFVRPI